MSSHVIFAGPLHMLIAFLWCGFLFLSIVGYGAAFLKLWRTPTPVLIVSASVGFGVVTFLGALLSAVNLLVAPVLIGFAVVGVVLFGIFVLPYLRGARSEELAGWQADRAGTLSRVLLGLFVIVFVLRLGASFHTSYYQAQDDYGYHLAAPLKTLAEHHLPADPFSERRIITSVGGYQFFNVLVLSVLPIEDLQMADRFPGLLLTALLAFALARRFRLTSEQRAAFALFVIAMTQLQFNLTYVILPSALFYALVYVAADEGLLERPWLQAVLLGMLTAAIGGTKSTYVVHAVIFCLLFAVLRGRRQGVASGARMLLVSAASCFVVLLPWMLVNRAQEGTMFYPLLGHGFHSSAYHQFASSARIPLKQIAKKVLPFVAPLVVIFGLEFRFGEKDEISRAATLLTLTAAIASAVLGIVTGGDSVRRYNYPCILPAILLAYPVFCHTSNRMRIAGRASSSARLLVTVFAAVSVALVLYVGMNSWTREFPAIGRDLHAGLTDAPIPYPVGVREEYSRADEALPRDGAILSTVYYPELFHFPGRTIYFADFPGAAGPPPGWPVKGSGEDLAAYLEHQHVRYLVYSYADDGGMPQSQIDEQLAQPNVTQVILAEAMAANVSHRQYRELGLTRRHVYDDGRIFILDLTAQK